MLLEKRPVLRFYSYIVMIRPFSEHRWSHEISHKSLIVTLSINSFNKFFQIDEVYVQLRVRKSKKSRNLKMSAFCSTRITLPYCKITFTQISICNFIKQHCECSLNEEKVIPVKDCSFDSRS